MSIEKQVRQDFEPMIQREIKFRIFQDRLTKLGFPEDLEADDFSLFFGFICSKVSLTPKSRRKPIFEVIELGEEFFGKLNTEHLLTYSQIV